jgi:hypothetical protein
MRLLGGYQKSTHLNMDYARDNSPMLLRVNADPKMDVLL